MSDQTLPASVNPSMNSQTLPQLAAPEAYVACRWDLSDLPEQRAYWLALFRRHLPGLLDEAVKVELADGRQPEDAQQRADQAQQTFVEYLETVAQQPERYGRLDILAICEAREKILRQAGFNDPYRLAKQRENVAALELLPQVLAELDAMDESQRAAALIQGVFAGNIFDLGATKTVDAFKHDRVDFYATRSQLKPRPWRVDDLDAWLAAWERRSWRSAVLFIDNAGPDIVLGMLPLARELVRRGTRVLLAANTSPTLNDVTADELQELLAEASQSDRAIREAIGHGDLIVLADGNGFPLIDLSRLDPAFVAEVAQRPVDLVVLEGMGRALESNYDARFTCDTLKIAMIKDEGVADAMGGELFDLVCRFEPAD